MRSDLQQGAVRRPRTSAAAAAVLAAPLAFVGCDVPQDESAAAYTDDGPDAVEPEDGLERAPTADVRRPATGVADPDAGATPGVVVGPYDEPPEDRPRLLLVRGPGGDPALTIERQRRDAPPPGSDAFGAELLLTNVSGVALRDVRVTSAAGAAGLDQGGAASPEPRWELGELLPGETRTLRVDAVRGEASQDADADADAGGE